MSCQYHSYFMNTNFSLDISCHLMYVKFDASPTSFIKHICHIRYRIYFKLSVDKKLNRNTSVNT